MPLDKVIVRPTIQSSFQKLTSAASILNEATDTLGDSIGALDDALTRLNVGVSAWISFNSFFDDNMPWVTTRELIGYAKVGTRKGLAIRVVEIDSQVPQEPESIKETWLFRDAPRELRLQAVEYIPELIEKLSEETQLVAKTVIEKMTVAMGIAQAVNKIADRSMGKGDKR